MGNLEGCELTLDNPNKPKLKAGDLPEIIDFSNFIHDQINLVRQRLSWDPQNIEEVKNYLKKGGVLQIEYDKSSRACIQDTFFFRDQKFFTKTSFIGFADTRDFIEPYDQGANEVPAEYVHSIIDKLIYRERGECYQLENF